MRKSREEELMDPLRYIWILFVEERHIPIKIKISSNDAYIQYERDGWDIFQSSVTS